MTKSNVEFPESDAGIGTQILEVMDEVVNEPRLATVRVQLQRKDLNNYESTMRSHAERCVSGR